MKRLIVPLVGLLFILPALACGSTAGTATQGGSAATATRASGAAPSAAASATTASGSPSVAPARSAVPSAAPSAAPAANVYPPNTLVSVKNWDMAVNRVERPGKELVWSQFGNKSNAAGEWLIVVFDMKNTGNTNFGVNTTDFTLIAPGGIIYRPSSDMGAFSYSTFKGGQQIGGQVPPGVSVTYYLPFDIAPGTTGLALVFNQDTKPRFTLP